MGDVDELTPEDYIRAYEAANAASYRKWLEDRIAEIERAKAAGERARDADV